MDREADDTVLVQLTVRRKHIHQAALGAHQVVIETSLQVQHYLASWQNADRSKDEEYLDLFEHDSEQMRYRFANSYGPDRCLYRTVVLQMDKHFQTCRLRERIPHENSLLKTCQVLQELRKQGHCFIVSTLKEHLYEQHDSTAAIQKMEDIALHHPIDFLLYISQRTVTPYSGDVRLASNGTEFGNLSNDIITLHDMAVVDDISAFRLAFPAAKVILHITDFIKEQNAMTPSAPAPHKSSNSSANVFKAITDFVAMHLRTAITTVDDARFVCWNGRGEVVLESRPSGTCQIFIV